MDGSGGLLILPDVSDTANDRVRRNSMAQIQFGFVSSSEEDSDDSGSDGSSSDDDTPWGQATKSRRKGKEGSKSAKVKLGSMADKWGSATNRKSSFVNMYASSESESEEEMTMWEEAQLQDERHNAA